MRLSSGINITFGTDYLGHAIVITGPPAGRVHTPGAIWTESGEKDPDGTICWRPAKGSTITRLNTPVENGFRELISAVLDKTGSETIHPALINGAASECSRLVPWISRDIMAQFEDFIAFLNSEFNYNLDTDSSEVLPFVDDYGPSLLTLVDDEAVVIPEIPPVYLAPKNWRSTMWSVANHMSGPFLFDDDIPDEDKIRITGLSIPKKDYTITMEGAFYYQAARFVLIFEAWNGDKNLAHLREFMRLLQAGIRPLRKVVE